LADIAAAQSATETASQWKGLRIARPRPTCFDIRAALQDNEYEVIFMFERYQKHDGMSPAVFVAGLFQETNAFGPLPTGLDSFTGRFSVGNRVATSPPPFPEALLGNLERRAASGELRLIRGPAAGAHPGGLVSRFAYESLRDHILAALAAARPIDIVALDLHGAMIAQGYLDCEGDLLARIRELAGPTVAIGALLDPHCHLSPAMATAADVLIAYKEYPHIDFRERADELVRILLRASRGEARPHTAVWDAGVIGVYHTNRPEVRTLVDRMKSWEQTGRILSASLIHGFPWGDSPDLGTRALVVSDGDTATADRLAAELAESAQSVAVHSPAHAIPLATALEQLAETASVGSPIVWADSADNPGGGAAGDSTYVLRALLERGETEVCLGPLWDPAAVAVAFNVGVGGRTAIRLGGKAGPLSGEPLDLQVEVLALANQASQTFAGAQFPLGRCAALRCAGVDVVVTTERDQARGIDLFTGMGIQPTDKRLIVVKSSQHFYDSFSRIAGRVVYLDCPGSLRPHLGSYPYRHASRPRWPLDAIPPAPRRVLLRESR
jgi:microcystin degradation protein MlrC